MPSFRRLSAAETAPLERSSLGARAQIALAYDAYLADFAIDDYGQAELAAGERRAVVRRRLHAAARRRGFTLRFRPGPNTALIFRVDVLPAAIVRPKLAPAPQPAQPRESQERQPDLPQRPPRRKQSAAERYQAVLPRWMRDGQSADRPSRRKRRNSR